ncbi:MAG: Snf7 family protein [Candidatus Thermoplasmatota archaeon]|nr:Snf7 family protein [Candidatus Thermoplasmatota archaeon]
MPIKFLKNDDEKFMEKKSRIMAWKSDIDRGVRQYEKNLQDSITKAKTAIKDNNTQKARVFAANILALDGAIKGLKDYKLFLENMEINLEFARTTKHVFESLQQGAKDLLSSQISEKENAQISTNINQIINSTSLIQSRLENQMQTISGAVNDTGNLNDEGITKIISSLQKNMDGKTTAEPSRADPESPDGKLDELIRKLSSENS